MVAASEALRSVGVDSFVVAFDESEHYESGVRLLRPKGSTNFSEAARQLEQTHVERTSVSNTLFSFDYAGVDLANNPEFEDVDVFHFHWIIGQIDVHSIRDLAAKGKSVVLTLHDEWIFTGGCHYTMGCERFTHSCIACPQLVGAARDLPNVFLSIKAEAFADRRIKVTAPSKWLVGESSRSLVLGNHSHSVIRNCVNLAAFHPGSRSERHAIRESLGLPADAFVLVIVSQTFEERRKGYATLRGALSLIDQTHPEAIERMALLCVGSGGAALSAMPVRSVVTGSLSSDAEIRRMYVAGDFLIQPALQENYSNVILEAMACGLPSIVSSAGGNPELVEDNWNGLVYDSSLGAAGLAGSIIQALDLREDIRRSFTETCLERAVQHSPAQIASRFIELYGSDRRASGVEPFRSEVTTLLHRRWSDESPFEELSARTAIPLMDALHTVAEFNPRATSGSIARAEGIAIPISSQITTAVAESPSEVPVIARAALAVVPVPPSVECDGFSISSLADAAMADDGQGLAVVMDAKGMRIFSDANPPADVPGMFFRLPERIVTRQIDRVFRAPISGRSVFALTPLVEWSADRRIEFAFAGFAPQPFRLGLKLQGGELIVLARRLDGPQWWWKETEGSGLPTSDQKERRWSEFFHPASAHGSELSAALDALAIEVFRMIEAAFRDGQLQPSQVSICAILVALMAGLALHD